MPAIPLSFANTSHVKLPACLQFRCLTDGVQSTSAHLRFSLFLPHYCPNLNDASGKIDRE